MPPRRVPTPFVTMLVALSVAVGASGQQRPNLLLVVTDDQRFDQMGCAGHPVLETPVIDRLAAQGVRFDNAFVSTAICAASRASILTGRREGRHGYTFGTPPMTKALADQTYLRLLTQNGYRTGFVGKWGVRFEDGALDGALAYRKTPSLPYIDKNGEHMTDRLAAHAIEFLQHEDKRPFCLTLAFHAPHAQDEHPDQYIPPPELTGLYADAEVPLPPHADDGFKALPEFLQRSMGRERWAWRFDTREKQVKRTRDYWRMITGVDRALGRVLAALAARGHADNTVVIFTSDNGYFLGERGLADKWLIYEESIRVPLIVHDPRLPAARCGAVQHEMALNLDLTPTLLALAGVPIPADYDGADLMPLVRGAKMPWRHDFLYEHRFHNPQIPKSVGVRGQRWVYACYDEQSPPYEQLFDLQQDPAELHDLARDPAHRTTLVAMRERCEQLRGVPLPPAK